MSKNITKTWFNSGYGSFSQAFSSATQVISSVHDAALSFTPIYSTIASTTTTVWNSHELISKYIISQKITTPVVNFCDTGYESAIVSQALHAAFGELLITYPASSTAAILAASVIATHPLETIETLKHVGSAFYHTVETGAFVAKGCAEISIAAALSAIDATSDLANNISLMGDSFAASESIIDYALVG